MNATSRSSDGEERPDLSALANAIEEGAGFPAITRAASRALGASLAVVDRSSAVLAIAALSPDEENKLRARGAGVNRHRLRVAQEQVGELRLRWHDEKADHGLLEIVSTVLALELVRSRSGSWADDEAASSFVESVLSRRVTAADEIGEQASELGADLGEGGGVVVGRLTVNGKAPDDWRERALSAGIRGLRSTGRGSLATIVSGDELSEIHAIVPASDTDQLVKASESMREEIAGSLTGIELTLGSSRHVERGSELFRAGKEALLALNVAEAENLPSLAFEDTGSYRLLLSTMSENPAELEWFYSDTVAPLIAYDQQYGTDLVATVETFLKNDGNIGPTAEQLFAHRHTIRYRLGRVRDLCGYDIQSTDGRERLGFGLKVMRVLGIGPKRNQPLDISDG